MKHLRPPPLPTIRCYLVLEKDFRGRQLGRIEHASDLQDAAEMAAIMLDRSQVRQVTVLLDGEKGIFVAHGKVPWIRYSKAETVKELRFAIVLEKTK